tara:strand:- start:320 stop:553 length:234 start_codon:yes stop_codon:yes gene_type:complete
MDEKRPSWQARPSLAKRELSARVIKIEYSYPNADPKTIYIRLLIITLSSQHLTQRKGEKRISEHILLIKRDILIPRK